MKSLKIVLASALLLTMSQSAMAWDQSDTGKVVYIYTSTEIGGAWGWLDSGPSFFADANTLGEQYHPVVNTLSDSVNFDKPVVIYLTAGTLTGVASYE